MIAHCHVRGNSCRSDVLKVFINDDGFRGLTFNKEMWSTAANSKILLDSGGCAGLIFL